MAGIRNALPLLVLLASVFPCTAESLSTYQGRLQTVREEVRAATKAGDPEQAIRAAQERLKGVAEVSFASGEQVRADNSALLRQLDAALAAEEEDRRGAIEGIVQRLDSLAGAVSLYHRAQQGEALGPDSQQATVALQKVLRRREFRQGPAQRGWSGLMRFIMRLVTRIFEAAGKAAGVLGWLVLALGAVGLVAMTVSLVLRAVRLGTRRWEITAPERPAKPPEGGPTNADEAQRRADQAAKKGDYREALRSLYRAFLLVLGEQGLIRYEQGKTNWEYVRALQGASAAVRETLAASTLLFEARWYGSIPATADDYAALVQRYGAVRETQARGRAEL